MTDQKENQDMDFKTSSSSSSVAPPDSNGPFNTTYGPKSAAEARAFDRFWEEHVQSLVDNIKNLNTNAIVNPLIDEMKSVSISSSSSSDSTIPTLSQTERYAICFRAYEERQRMRKMQQQSSHKMLRKRPEKGKLAYRCTGCENILVILQDAKRGYYICVDKKIINFIPRQKKFDIPCTCGKIQKVVRMPF